MSSANLRVSYRPVRVGWCVRQGNIDDVRSSLLKTHTLWGGRYNPIIPVGIGGDPHERLRRLGVDVLYPAAEVADLIAFTESFPYLRWPVHHHRGPEFFTEMGSGIISPFLDVYHPVMNLHKEYVKGEAKSKVSATIFSWNSTDPLADIFLAEFGAYPGAADVKLDYTGFVIKMLDGRTVSVGSEDSIPSDAYKALTPSAITRFDLEPDQVSEYDGFYVGEANNFDDIVNFWNLRAADLELFFFDFQQEERLADLRDAFVGAIHRRPRGLRDWPSFVRNRRIWGRNFE
jgi:hypothetical protein